MQLALPADSPDHDFSSGRSPSTRRRNKFVIAGVAMASVGVMAVNPVTPALPDLQDRAVELAAFANPIAVWQQTITNTLGLAGTLGTDVVTTLPGLAQAMANPAILSEVANIISANATNPIPALTALLGIPSTYGEAIGTANQASMAALQTALQNLPAILQNTANYLATGQFVEAFSEINIYVLVQLLERPGRPLFPLLTIPGDIAAAIPGAQILPQLLDTLLTRGTMSGLTRALLAPGITAALQVAEILDAVKAAVVAGDAETAVSELINMPARVVNAFVNGYVPNFPTRSLFQGLLSPNGPLDFFLVDLPRAIAAGLTPPVAAPAAGLAATAALAPASTSPSAIPVAEAALVKVDAAPAAAATAVTAPAAETAAVAPVSTETATEADASETAVDGSDEGTETEGGSTGATDDDSSEGSTGTTDTDSDAGDDETKDTSTSGTSSGSASSGSTSSSDTSASDKSDSDSDSSKSDTSKSDSDKSDSDSSGGAE